ncbi:Ldh family oxidoreductase [Bacillus hominis]|uniref:Ldh family oxidoreductase n=1 Tax=Bacillus hominis TaxID=2817478 RepID=UPI00259FFCEF|nr:Ldh family oxidoreductase [Bacillus hominis]MDM5436494.1 Ldh family oxidoreductase [Bacillus hominis]
MSQLITSSTINIKDLKKFIENVFMAFNVPKNKARIAADVIVTADVRGIQSHGCTRIIPFYLPLIIDKVVKIEEDPKLTLKHSNITYINANKSLGFSTSYEAMNNSIEVAKECNLGVTFVTNSTHFGIASYYSMMAAKKNLIGITITNGSPAVVAPGGKDSFLGTNAVSVAFPNPNNQPLVMDIALSITSLGNLFLEIEKEKEVPAKWAAASFLEDNQLSPNTKIDPRALYESRMIASLGAGDKKGEYKGFQLGLLVDILMAVLGGGKFSFEQSKGEAVHLFIAIKPHIEDNKSNYADAFLRLEKQFRNYEVIEGYERLRMPGERSNHLENIAIQNGIKIDSRMKSVLSELSEVSGVSLNTLHI